MCSGGLSINPPLTPLVLPAARPGPPAPQTVGPDARRLAPTLPLRQDPRLSSLPSPMVSCPRSPSRLRRFNSGLGNFRIAPQLPADCRAPSSVLRLIQPLDVLPVTLLPLPTLSLPGHFLFRRVTCLQGVGGGGRRVATGVVVPQSPAAAPICPGLR